MDMKNKRTRIVKQTSSLTISSGYSEIIYARPRTLSAPVYRNF